MMQLASEAFQLAAVKQNGYSIQSIIMRGIVPSEAVQLEAVNERGDALQFIENPSTAVQLAAVKKYGDAIRHIKLPIEEVQIAAVTKNPFSIEYIQQPSPILIKMALTSELALRRPLVYDNLVHQLFKDNNLLVKKWLRYGETMRTN